MLRKNNTPVVADLLRNDPDRTHRYRCRQGDWTLDFSRLPLTDETLSALTGLPDRCGLSEAVGRLFAGDPVNRSEGRPALHMALRASDPSIFPAADTVALQRERFLDLARKLHEGRHGIRDVLHIGIGGSDLGPRLVATALDDDDSAVRVHWLSTLDGRRFARLCRTLDPRTTALIVASKSFSTEETLVQAEAARQWLGPDWPERTWAATADAARAQAFGVRPDHVLEFPDWTGGRYSLWSAVGVSAAARIGVDAFDELLAGAEQADQDFRAGDAGAGMAVMLALVMHHLRRELDLDTLGVVSYEPRLALLADHLQQLVMESLGKGVDVDDRPLERGAAPLIFGGRGTDLQHSIFQALHQGIDTHPLILVGSERDDHDHPDWHDRQMAHLLAQAEAFTHGRSDGRPCQNMPGNRPVATLTVDRLRPGNLGWLLATLEHTVYTLSVLWRVNPFDQWGVEEGKRLAEHIRKQRKGR